MRDTLVRTVLAFTGISAFVLPYGCHLGPLPPNPDLGGRYLTQSAEIDADSKTVKDILATFRAAEQAIQRRDLPGIMSLYAEHYQHHGLTKLDLQRIWKDLFDRYHDLSSTHVFTRMKAQLKTTAAKAEITCTGSLWGISNETNKRENIDSWFGEVHHLAYENGAWRVRGNAWEPIAPRAGSVGPPPHAFF